MGTLVLQLLSILVYPGLLLVAAGGLACEVALTRRPAAAVRTLTRPVAPMVAAAALGGLAAAQLAAPFSLGDSGDSNLLVALSALAVGTCLAWAAAGGRGGPLFLGGLAAAALALLIPAVLVQDLHPQVLAVGGLLAAGVRAACAVLYLLGLGAMLATLQASPLRLWFWLPAGGLGASVFVPAPADDAVGLLQFFGLTVAVIAVAAFLARFTARLL